MIMQMSFKKYLDFIVLLPQWYLPMKYFESVVPILKQTPIYTQSTYTQHWTDQLSMVKTSKRNIIFFLLIIEIF